jgi:hypothetical protein
MPFTDADAKKRYYAQYAALLKSGDRKSRPKTLDEALEELKTLRALVQKQRKRIWYLENKDSQAECRRLQRRAAYDQDFRAALSQI